MFPLQKKQFVIKNCLSGEHKIWSKFPATVGGEWSDFPLTSVSDELFRFLEDQEGLQILTTPNASCLLDGTHNFEPLIPFEQDHSLLSNQQMFLFRHTKNPTVWLKNLSCESWCLSSLEGTTLAGPTSIRELMKNGASMLENNPSAVLRHTYSNSGFYLHQLEFLFPAVPRAVAPSKSFKPNPQPVAAESKPIAPVNTESGHFTCPVCWLRFDRGDTMHIAVHQNLKGDSILGEDAMLRFLATNFNDKGQGLDAMGIPTSDLACPHCRSKLPPGFMDLKQHIFSIVGAPQSGKSYFLSVLTHVAKRTLFSNFKTTFHDGDPTGNRLLTTVTNNLFSASTPEQARIAKTGLEGDMYLEIPRRGRKVKMPRPFTFQLTPVDEGAQPVSLVFYDNAGEHFEPGIDAHMSPGAQHISAASGIVYLFDPTYNLAFRKRLQGLSSDPQLSAEGFDQQDTLLAEMNVRVKNLRGLDFRQKIETPLAVVVGKCDVWAHLIGASKFENPVADGFLDFAKIRHNSEIVRTLLHELVPPIASNSEIISRNVCYFPSSSFGCSPTMVLDKSGNPKLENGRPILGPDPAKISPILVEVPLLWLLSQSEPGIVPPQNP